MIRSSLPFISGIVFSGGEPTMQREALVRLARFSKKIGLAVGVQTNGMFPATLNQLIEECLVDKVALDFKSRFEGYSGGGEKCFSFENYERNAKKSFSLCRSAYAKDILKEFEVVMTIFYENEEYIQKISKMIGNIPLVLQQGEHKILRLAEMPADMTEGEYWVKKRQLQDEYHPLTMDEIKKIAGTLGRKVRIRTREAGEIQYNTRGHP